LRTRRGRLSLTSLAKKRRPMTTDFDGMGQLQASPAVLRDRKRATICRHRHRMTPKGIGKSRLELATQYVILFVRPLQDGGSLIFQPFKLNATALAAPHWRCAIFARCEQRNYGVALTCRKCKPMGVLTAACDKTLRRATHAELQRRWHVAPSRSDVNAGSSDFCRRQRVFNLRPTRAVGTPARVAQLARLDQLGRSQAR
jgi:hypothetical protein